MCMSPGTIRLQHMVFGAIGIALVAGAAAATNCLLEGKRDGVRARTRRRPLASGRIKIIEAAAFAAGLGIAGLALLHTLVNPLTMWLTLATFAGRSEEHT